MKIIILFFLICSSTMAQKIEFRGLYGGVQTISSINNPSFSHSVYLIGLVGKKKITFNIQPIIPIQNKFTPLIKFGLDYKIL